MTYISLADVHHWWISEFLPTVVMTCFPKMHGAQEARTNIAVAIWAHSGLAFGRNHSLSISFAHLSIPWPFRVEF
jgi:hypothetical protein